MTKLFENRTTDGASASYAHTGGYMSLHVFGTFDGASVDIQLSSDDTTFQSSLTVTDDSVKLVFIPAGVYLKAVISSAGGSTSLDVHLVK